jgi:hypothetical protein
MAKPVEQGRFGEMMQKAMEAKGWDINKTSEALGITYEHTRKLIRSRSYPSKLQLGNIAKVLDLDPTKAQELVTADKIKHTYGALPAVMTRKTARFERLERVLPRLTAEDYDRLVLIAESLAKAGKNRG